MSRIASVHVVQRSDGIWQVERETEVIPLSVHDDRDDAIDAALVVAGREHLGVAVHQTRRRRARWMDRVAWALLDDAERAGEPVRRVRPGHPRRLAPHGPLLRRAAG